MATLRLDNLTRTFRRRREAVPAVVDLSLQTREGELVVFVGPSGCGKTTTLRLIAGLEDPDAGAIFIDDRDVRNIPPRERDVAMVFQGYALYPHMTVYGNLAFGLKMRRTPRAESDRRVREAAALLGIEQLLHRRPGTLSGGEQQRVAVGRAIVRNARMFLFDEPLASLDAPQRLQMRREIRTLQRRLQTTTIYVTHDQEEAMTMGDRLAVMCNGRLQQFAEPMEIYNRPANRFVARFIGSPPMNLLPGRLTAVDGRPHFESNSLRIAIDTIPDAGLVSRSPNVLAGVRPEDFRLICGSESALTNGEQRISGCTIEVVEPLGSASILHVRSTSGQSLVVRGPAEAPRPGERVDLGVSPGRLHLFGDEETGARLL
ncbi:MAG: ABC transporter ATP-binding protein [Phycisphaerae bacterium]|nr:ABC transporter ATP-binding protein [Phycisphaerae bacterium]